MGRFTRFLTARFSRKGHLGLHLTVGLLVALLALWIFAALAEDVVTRDAITKVDLSLFRHLRQFAVPGEDTAFVAISLFGSPTAMGVIGTLGAVWLAIRREWPMLIG